MLQIATLTSRPLAGKVEKAEAHVLGYGCLLCRGRSLAEMIMVFIPNRDSASAFGEAAGHRRHILYGLCTCCHSQPDYTARAEAAVLDNLPRSRT